MYETTLISARNLTKRFGDSVAVDSINFNIRKGECFGLLGPNGAGKTTTIQMISCLSPLTEGELLIEGNSVSVNQSAIKASLGIVSQNDSLDPDLTVKQNLMSYSRFFNIPKEIALERSLNLLRIFQLDSRSNDRPDHLSGGMRRRLLIARALINKPHTLVLDEPTTGLDPQTRHLVWNKLSELKTDGITILITTHYMEEAAHLCDRLLVMDRGQIIAQGNPTELIQRHVGEQLVEVKTSSASEKELLLSILGSHGISFDDTGSTVCVYADGDTFTGDTLSHDDYEIVRRPANLEDVFLRLTGRGLRE